MILVEAGPRILPSFPEDLAQHAARDLADLGVEVRVNSMVTAVGPDGVSIGAEKIRARTAFWAAGNKASPLGKFLGAPLDNAGRVKVKEDLSVPGHPEIFAIGDLATLFQDGRTVPWVCPAAIQEGRFAAKSIIRDLRHQPRKTFHYFNKGDLATIGRSRAIADFGKVRVTGLAGVGAVAVRPHHVSGWLPQPPRGIHRMGVRVFHVSGGRAADHGRGEVQAT